MSSSCDRGYEEGDCDVDTGLDDASAWEVVLGPSGTVSDGEVCLIGSDGAILRRLSPQEAVDAEIISARRLRPMQVVSEAKIVPLLNIVSEGNYTDVELAALGVDRKRLEEAVLVEDDFLGYKALGTTD